MPTQVPDCLEYDKPSEELVTKQHVLTVEASRDDDITQVPLSVNNSLSEAKEVTFSPQQSPEQNCTFSNDKDECITLYSNVVPVSVNIDELFDL